ncbi:NPCBM/NEW2 domain-containing protein [Cellvibrio mixtus]|uniref:NPCBM/NEW2 domain-containing protein n=1 Tax=Cellvibrio mixtus TaxID=39650 RepID=UPI000586A41E|nr:NPCBM/NEW2 domain-containing protein [Cellvibrio mixtus]
MNNDNTADNIPPQGQAELISNTTTDISSSVQVPHVEFIPLDQLTDRFYSAKQFLIYFQFYLCAAIVANLGLLFWDGNGGDIGFWEDWVKQLSNRGYKDFNGNYPPLYIHWLYVASQLYNYLQLPVENNLFLKYVSLIPIFLSHFLLIAIVHRLLKNYCTSANHYHACMLLTALNPALFMNGPIWGQVDVLPVIPVLLAILASTSKKYRALTFPIYTVALLTKFQMIAFAPVMGIIFFRHYKIHLVGCALSLLTIVLLFLPSIVVGSFAQSFKLAYIDVLHQYGATTMGAANIWILLTGNAAPDTVILFGIEPDSPLAIIFKAKNFGMIGFFLVCLIVFLQGMGKLIDQQLPQNNPQNAAQLFFYAMICTMAFFALLPAMHERYLLPAVIVSLVYYALNPGKIIFPLLFTFISAFNVAMCLGIRTSHVWPAISWIMVGAFSYAVLELLFGKHWSNFTGKLFSWFFAIKYIALVVLVIGFYLIGQRLYLESKPIDPELQPHQLSLTELPVAFSKQDYGQLNINKSVNGNPLRADEHRYAKGLGTHANSIIEYQLPPKTKTITVSVALDDEVESASVKFTVWGDDRLLWESRNHYGAEKPEFAEINLESVQRLRLQVDGINDIGGDHADWLNPIITLAAPDTPAP